MILTFICILNFKLYQIDVNNMFLNNYISEEVHVDQCPKFLKSYFCNHVFKLKNAFYGLIQAPRAWYKRLRKFSSMTFYLCKSMSLILLSVLLMNPWANNFLIWCIINSRSLWWGNYNTSLIKERNLHQPNKIL